MRGMKLYLLPMLLVLFGHTLFSQSYEMTNGTINTCSGTFYDSGGPTGSNNYSNNEDFVFTICPSAPGFLVQLDFTMFDTEAGYDFLEVFDGPDVLSPGLGTYDNSVPLLGTVGATAGNITGCVTFRFTSDGSFNYEGWAATISCIQPCQLVQAVLNSSSPAPVGGAIKICQGDNVSFTGSGDYPQSGTNYVQSDGTSTFEWNFGDGTSATGQSVSHTYTSEGSYYVQLTVTDVQGCVSTNRIDQLVQVSTTPLWTGTSAAPDPICLGETAVLTGVVIPQEHEQICTPVISSPLALPDGTGVSYTTCVNLDCYGPGQTLNNINDFLGICLDMEHSYIGDLQIEITCPTGENVIMSPYPNGGTNTYLGVPVDNDATPGIQGTCWNYCFTPTATNGTWPAEAGAMFGGSLPAGDYQSVNSFNGLIGCELNGDWCITITDNLGSDNGFICGWGVDLDAGLTPPATAFTPNVVTEGWQADPTIIATSGNQITVLPTSVGSPCYTYEMTDDFGCTYDTTICITVIPGVTVFDQVITLCENPIGSGTVSNIDLTALESVIDGGAGYTFLWFNDLLLTSAVVPPTSVTVSDGQVFYAQADDGNCTAVATITYNITALSPPTIAATDESCDGLNDGTATATPIGMSAPLSYSWSTSPVQTSNPATGIDPGVYDVTVTDANGCVVTAPFTIDPGPLVVAVIAPIANQCLTGNSFSFDGSGSTISSGSIADYTWDFGDGSTGSGATSTHSYSSSGPYTVSLTVTDGVCTDQITQNITVFDMPTVIASGTPVSCFGFNDGTLSAIASGTSGYTYDWDIPAVGSSQTGLGPGTYTVTVTDVNGCEATDSYEVIEPPVLEVDLDLLIDADCNGAATGEIRITASGGAPAYSFSWSGPGGPYSVDDIGSLLAGTYDLTVTDDNGCETTYSATIVEPDAIVVIAGQTDANCALQMERYL